MDGNARSVWIKYQYVNCINISDALCSFPVTLPRNLDIKQHAENTNNTRHQTTCREHQQHITAPPRKTSNSGPHHKGVADPSVLLWLVALSEAAICHQSSPALSFAVLCSCACVRCVGRLALAAKNKNIHLR